VDLKAHGFGCAGQLQPALDAISARRRNTAALFDEEVLEPMEVDTADALSPRHRLAVAVFHGCVLPADFLQCHQNKIINIRNSVTN